MASSIPDDYYDLDTHALMMTSLTEEDKEYIKNMDEKIVFLMFKRWRMIVNSFPMNYLNQYISLSTAETRNSFIKKYLSLDSHDIAGMLNPL